MLREGSPQTYHPNSISPFFLLFSPPLPQITGLFTFQFTLPVFFCKKRSDMQTFFIARLAYYKQFLCSPHRQLNGMSRKSLHISSLEIFLSFLKLPSLQCVDAPQQIQALSYLCAVRLYNSSHSPITQQITFYISIFILLEMYLQIQRDDGYSGQ